MPEQPPNPEQEPILSFDEFSALGERDKPKHNFYLCFSKGMLGEAFRKTEYYQKFAAENPALAESLIEQIDSEGFDPIGDFPAVVGELYEAYIIMRGYGASNNNLMV